MHVLTFCNKVITLCLMHQGSVISWGRSVTQNKIVGGHASSLHLAFLAIDVQFDTASGQEGAKLTCNRLGLHWSESGYQCLHLQALAVPEDLEKGPYDSDAI